MWMVGWIAGGTQVIHGQGWSPEKPWGAPVSSVTPFSGCACCSWTSVSVTSLHFWVAPTAFANRTLGCSESRPAWYFSSDFRLVMDSGVLPQWSLTSCTEHSGPQTQPYTIWWDLWWEFKVWVYDTIFFPGLFILAPCGANILEQAVPPASITWGLSDTKVNQITHLPSHILRSYTCDEK